MTNRTEKRGVLHRAVTLVLTLSLLLGLLPVQLLTPSASAHWAQPSLNKLVDLGIMRGDSRGLRPDANVTRAEFVAMINRAYGYEKSGAIPFKDVFPQDWYAEDIAIAYNTGYFKGTSPNTASPNGSLTREEAIVMLGRNMMMDETVGEAMTFADGRDFSTWSRGYIETASRFGLVNGYEDGTFRAKNKVTRAEVATMMSNALGTVLNEGGEYTLGGVYGNVTINSSGTKLKNSVIAGDLYVTGGLDKGYATLENVTVLGRIIVSGGGEGNEGNNSVLFRNVDADKVIVDRFDNQFVTLRAEGVTTVGDVDVRTSAYLEDTTPTGYGFLNIGFDADTGSTLDLSGNIEKVTNFTPGSVLKLAKGSAQDITVDEAARESSFLVDSGAVAYNVNLDAATMLDGLGSVTKLNVAAPGSEATILPDYIYIRPGITADVNGERMDTQAADQASEDPRLLSGYGAARNVAPTSFDAVFAANKRGTVYWAITSVADGSLDAEDLINPPAYATVIVKSGNLKVTAAEKEVTAKVSGLAKGGTYYLSAVFVDDRGMESPVKVTRFTTPDDTVPNFASGYPYMSQITNVAAQVAVMTNKSCKLYWALFPKGSTAPTAQDFKSASVSGNLGYGTTDMEKNSSVSFQVNSKILVELESYDLYLWLTDHDGAKSSAVRKISFTTADKTPPFFNVDLTVTKMQATSITTAFNLNENGTVYWVAVEAGAEYPKPLAGQLQKPALDSDAAKLQVTSGINAIKSGKANASENKDGTINISGLEKEKSYDIYYVAQDKAGNYSDVVKMITANTLDASSPTVTQEFTRYYGTDITVPLAETDVRIIFSEGVQQNSTGKDLLSLYTAVLEASDLDARNDARNALADALRDTIKLYPSPNNDGKVVEERQEDAEVDWIIDYRNAVVTLEEGKTVVTFQTTDDAAKDSALSLSSGASYYFQVQDIADTSTAKNVMGITKLPAFTTVFAQINLSTTNEPALADGRELDMSFRLVPVSTSKVEDMNYDMLLWTDATMTYELYYRVLNQNNEPLELSDNQPVDKDGNGAWDILTSGDGWKLLNEREIIFSDVYDYEGLSLTRRFLPFVNNQPDFAQLSELKENCYYEYAVRVVKLEGSTDRDTWSKRVNMKISIAAGLSHDLDNLSRVVTPVTWSTYRAEGGVTSIGLPENFAMHKQFSDVVAPSFTDGRPVFYPGDTYVDMELLLNRSGTVYYAVAPEGLITTRYDYDGEGGADAVVPEYEDIPESGAGSVYGAGLDTMILSTPTYLNIVNPNYTNSLIQTGSVSVGSGVVDRTLTDLQPEKNYIAYFVIKGTGQVYSDVYCYRFKTKPITRPTITLQLFGESASIKTNYDSTANYILLIYNRSSDDSYNKLLRERFSTYLTNDAKLRAEYNRLYGNKTGSDGQRGYTVLDVLLNDHFDAAGNVLGSIFDYFARQDIKDTVATNIQAQSTTDATISKTGQVELGKDIPQTVNCRANMVGTTEYLLLVVAKSDLGSGYAFRGIMPLKLADNEAPLVTSCTFTMDSYNSSGQLPTFTGELTVNFDEDIYIKEGTGTMQEYIPVENRTDFPPTSGFVSMTTAVTSMPSSIQIVPRTDGAGKTTHAVTFKVTNAVRNTKVVFNADLCDSGGHTRAGGALTLVLNYRAFPDPIYPDDPSKMTYDPYFEITSRAWDATGITH